MKFKPGDPVDVAYKSHPARGAWIEMRHLIVAADPPLVAPRKGCVD